MDVEDDGMPLGRTDFRRNVIDLIDRALTRGVVVDSGVAAPPARAAWPADSAPADGFPANAAPADGFQADAAPADGTLADGLMPPFDHRPATPVPASATILPLTTPPDKSSAGEPAGPIHPEAAAD